MGRNARSITHSVPHRILSCVLTLLLCCALVPTTALAETTAADVPAFREDCFERSSFLGCTHLATLSSQLCFDSEDTAALKARLEGFGFTSVSANTYAARDIKDLPDGMGVTVGMRKIREGGVPYTLLAVAPRSFYRAEWIGNFTIGRDGVHKGFKDARDEACGSCAPTWRPRASPATSRSGSRATAAVPQSPPSPQASSWTRARPSSARTSRASPMTSAPIAAPRPPPS